MQGEMGVSTPCRSRYLRHRGPSGKATDGFGLAKCYNDAYDLYDCTIYARTVSWFLFDFYFPRSLSSQICAGSGTLLIPQGGFRTT